MALTFRTTAALARVRSAVQLNNNLAAASITIIYFDYCLTIAQEIDCFWGAATRWSVGSGLFVLNRYLGLLGIFPVMLECFGHYTPQRCRQLQTYHQYYSIATQVIVAAILLLRTVALYNGSRRVLWSLLTFCASAGILTVLVIANVIHVTSASSDTANTPADIAYLGYCDLSLTIAQGIRSAVGWICMLGVETTIFSLTLYKSIRMRASLRHGVLGILLRDGAIYYGILVLIGATNLITFLVPGIGDNDRGVATTLANALSTTLTSRMFLNLRDPKLHRGVMRIGRRSLSHSSRPGSIGLQTLSMSRADAGQTLSFRRSVESETDTDVEIEEGADADHCGQAY